MNLMDSRAYSRKSNYKGLLDTDECQVNQITDDHHQHSHYVENAQIDSASNLKYNKRIKKLIDNKTNGNYVTQNYLNEDQDKQLPSDQLENTRQQSTENFEQIYAMSQNEQQNLMFCEKNDGGKKISNRKDMKSDIKSPSTYNRLMLQDNAHNINSNDDTTIRIAQTNEVNHLAQHFNDRLQTQSMARTYSPQCGGTHNENTKTLLVAYSNPILNETLNGTSHQQCEQSYGKTYQNHERDNV